MATILSRRRRDGLSWVDECDGRSASRRSEAGLGGLGSSDQAAVEDSWDREEKLRAVFRTGVRVRASVAELGLEVHDVQVRDLMLAGNLRSAFADVVVARQQGLAALEKARGETAAIRNLANSAELMERHPGIMQLRLLQAVENSPGNRVVIALDPERGRVHDVQATAELDN
jgi:regulator of protease activity HflC (stomatin/prohibitin superfamily)